MIVQTSRAVRRLVGRLEQGETVHEALVAIANAHEVMAGQVTATGVIDEVVVAVFDPAKRAYGPAHAYRGAMQVLSLQGTLSWLGNALVPQLQVALARETDNGLQVLGGQLVSARVVVLELAVECWDDVTLERAADPRTGLALWTAPPAGGNAAHAVVPPSQQPAPPAPAPATIAHAPATSAHVASPAHAGAPSAVTAPIASVSAPAVAAAIAAASTTAAAPASAPRTLTEAARALDAMPARPGSHHEEELDRPEPAPGDILDHPSFGLVEVESEDDQGRLRIRLPSGSRREILLEVFDITQREPRSGKRVWALRPRRR